MQFEAKAFQGPWDEEPVWKLYKVRTRATIGVLVAHFFFFAGKCFGVTGFLNPSRTGPTRQFYLVYPTVVARAGHIGKKEVQSSQSTLSIHMENKARTHKVPKVPASQSGSLVEDAAHPFNRLAQHLTTLRAWCKQAPLSACLPACLVKNPTYAPS